MANDYFEFKQFKVHQSVAAMKVGTDGVLLGAWADLDGMEKRILDIGTGTGLIALMAAQRSLQAQVDAVEIDEQAAQQAQDNFSASPWPGRMTVHAASIQQFAAQATGPYDHILSNPPFFVSSLKTPDISRTLARHADTLPFTELIPAVTRLLSPQGRFSVIYPKEEGAIFEEKAVDAGLHCNRKTRVKGTTEGAVKRILMEFSFHSSRPVENELIIEAARQEYTAEYRELTRDFYLKF